MTAPDFNLTGNLNVTGNILATGDITDHDRRQRLRHGQLPRRL